MKKSAVLFLLLFCVSVGTLDGLAVWVNQGAEAVVVTGETVLGDPDRAAGLELTARSEMRLQLGWKTAFSPANPNQTSTDFTFYSMIPSMWERFQTEGGAYISIESKAITTSMTSTGELELSDMDDIWQYEAARPALDISREMKPGEEKTQTVCLSDYYDAVPLYIDFRGRMELADAEEQKNFRDYFYIPMPEGIYVTCTLTKNDSGGVNHVEMVSEQELSVTSRTARSDRGWLVVMDGWARMAPDAPAQRLDFSQVKGGYGLYLIPSDTPEKMDAWDGSLDFNGIETLFPIPEGERGMDVCLDDQGRVLLFTAKEDLWYLTVLDPEGRTQLQRLELGELGRDNKVLELGSGEDGLSILMEDLQVCALSQGADGYEVEFSCSLPLEMKLKEETPVSIAWDGERLAMAGIEADSLPTHYILAIWEEGACTFLGRYTTSLEQDNMLTSSSLEQIEPTEKNPISLAWSS